MRKREYLLISATCLGLFKFSVAVSAPNSSKTCPKGDGEISVLLPRVITAVNSGLKPSRHECVPAPSNRLSPVSTTSSFLPNEKFDVNNPRSLDRILLAFQEDKKTKELLEDVMSKAGVKDPREIIRYSTGPNSFLGGNASLEVTGDPPGAVLKGWPAIALDGTLLVDPSPESKLRVHIMVKSNEDMITTYSSLVHELTHVQGDLNRVKSVHLFDVLNYKNPEDYARQKIMEPGGERDAFVAEISAVIRYRNRTHSPYGSFHTPVTEKFFDEKSGTLKDGPGLIEHINHFGGAMAYLENYSQVFRKWVEQEFSTLKVNASSLREEPNFSGSPEKVEELARLNLRIQKIKERFPELVPKE